MRVRELVNSGTKSQCATGLTGKELIQELRAFPGSRMIYGQNDLEERFTALRANAEKWHANRTAFMETRFAEGKHPDTDSDFWDGYREIPPERVDYGLLREWMVQNPSRALGTIVLTAIIGIGVVSYWLTRFVRSLIEKRQNNVTRL